MFKITEKSIEESNFIIQNMENKTFHNHYHILYDICESLNHNELVYLEIGSFAGGSASLVSRNKNVKKVISVDIGTPIPKEIPIKNVDKFKNNNCEYFYVEGDSKLESTINKVKLITDKVDILFIDGDHKYNAVISDFNNYKHLVKKGGYIVFDDYLDDVHSPDVFHAVNDIVEGIDKNEYEVIGSLVYDLLVKTNNPNLLSSNEYILKKIK